MRGYLKRGARDAAEIVDAVGKHDIIGEAFAFRERRKLKRIKYDFIDCIDRGRVAGKSDGRRIDLVIKACKAHAGRFHKVNDQRNLLDRHHRHGDLDLIADRMNIGVVDHLIVEIVEFIVEQLHDR